MRASSDVTKEAERVRGVCRRGARCLFCCVGRDAVGEVRCPTVMAQVVGQMQYNGPHALVWRGLLRARLC